jgi:hypothetical protein
LTDSNGRGGFHLRVVLASPVPSRDLYCLLHWMAAEVGYEGELFPKQAQLRSRFGNWLRLPGRHHTRDCWATAFDGASWLRGEAAVELLLGVAGDDPALVPKAPPAPRDPPPLPCRSSPWRARLNPVLVVRGPATIEQRVIAYLAKVPNLAGGQGRDDMAYQAACFLVRDMNLSDAEALDWLEGWDAGNRPPKGKERLEYVIGSARKYGRGAYGSAAGRGAS